MEMTKKTIAVKQFEKLWNDESIAAANKVEVRTQDGQTVNILAVDYTRDIDEQSMSGVCSFVQMPGKSAKMAYNVQLSQGNYVITFSANGSNQVIIPQTEENKNIMGEFMKVVNSDQNKELYSSLTPKRIGPSTVKDSNENVEADKQIELSYYTVQVKEGNKETYKTLVVAGHWNESQRDMTKITDVRANRTLYMIDNDEFSPSECLECLVQDLKSNLYRSSLANKLKSLGAQAVKEIVEDKNNGNVVIEYYETKEVKGKTELVRSKISAIDSNVANANKNLVAWTEKEYAQGKAKYSTYSKGVYILKQNKIVRNVAIGVASGLVLAGILTTGHLVASNIKQQQREEAKIQEIAKQEAYDSIVDESDKAFESGVAQIEDLVDKLTNNGEKTLFNYFTNGQYSVGSATGFLKNANKIEIYQQSPIIMSNGEIIGEGKFDYTEATLSAFSVLGKETANELYENGIDVAMRKADNGTIEVLYSYIIDSTDSLANLTSSSSMVKAFKDAGYSQEEADYIVKYYQEGFNDEVKEIISEKGQIIIPSEEERNRIDYLDDKVTFAISSLVGEKARAIYCDNQTMFAISEDNEMFFRINLQTTVATADELVSAINKANDNVETYGNAKTLISHLNNVVNTTKLIDSQTQKIDKKHGFINSTMFVSNVSVKQDKDTKAWIVCPTIVYVDETGKVAIYDEASKAICRNNVYDSSEMLLTALCPDWFGSPYTSQTKNNFVAELFSDNKVNDTNAVVNSVEISDREMG